MRHGRRGAPVPSLDGGSELATLLERGVVLRPMGGYGLPQWLRITVGTGDENARLLAALDEVLT